MNKSLELNLLARPLRQYIVLFKQTPEIYLKLNTI